MAFLKINPDDLPSSVSEFFTAKEFEKLSEYEKLHLSNLRQNYEALRSAGLLVKPPEFMVKKKLKKKRQKRISRSVAKSSDEEWIPAAKIAKTPRDLRKRLSSPQEKLCSKQSRKKKQSESLPEQNLQVYHEDTAATDLDNKTQTFVTSGKEMLVREKTRLVSKENNRAYPCTQCYLSYSQFAFLEQHMKRKHSHKYWEECKQYNVSNNGLQLDTRKVVSKTLHKKLDICAESTAQDNTKSEMIKDKLPLMFCDCQEKNVNFNQTKVYEKTTRQKNNISSELCFDLHESKKCCKRYNKIQVNTRMHTAENVNNHGVCNVDFVGNSKIEIRKVNLQLDGHSRCDISDVSLSQNGYLKKQKRKFTADKPNKCDFSDYLKSNKREHAKGKIYDCDICSSSFSMKCNLKRRRTQTEEKPHECNVCSAKFISNRDLTAHKRRHTGERPYKCDVCSAKFVRSNELTVHKRRHTGEKPYKCNVCSSKFISNRELTVHKRRHTGERPYKCDVCSAKFVLSNELTVHKRRHTGEKPYKCNVCSSKFISNRELTAHKRRHTGERPYRCDVCSSNFLRSDELKVHKRKHRSETIHLL